MLDKIKLERQKLFCKYCGKEMTAGNECDFYILPYPTEADVEVCCKECLPKTADIKGFIVSIPNQRTLFSMFNIDGKFINGIDCPYIDLGPGTTPEEFDRLEYEYEEKIIGYATRDRSYMEDWGDGDETEER